MSWRALPLRWRDAYSNPNPDANPNPSPSPSPNPNPKPNLVQEVLAVVVRERLRRRDDLVEAGG